MIQSATNVGTGLFLMIGESIHHGKHLLTSYIFMFSLLHYNRLLAEYAGQKFGPDAYWDIVAFPTYEEAYAHTLGYEYDEMADILCIVAAVAAYRAGSYIDPAQYFIVPDIPPKRFFPVHPSEVVSWNFDPPRDLNRRKPKPERRDPILRRKHISFNDSSFFALSLGPSSTPKSGASSRDSGIKPRASKTPSRSSPAHQVITSKYSSENVKRFTLSHPPKSLPSSQYTLTTPMRRCLRTYFDLSKQDLLECTKVIESPHLVSKCYPMFREKGLSDEEIAFLLDWAFDSFDPSDDEEVANRENRDSE